MVKLGRRVHERRGVDRPSNGTTHVCLQCGIHEIEFNEKYRFPTSGGAAKPTPAWVCSSPTCGYWKPARQDDELLEAAPKLRRAAKELRAKTQRQLMKARSARERAARALAKSAARPARQKQTVSETSQPPTSRRKTRGKPPKVSILQVEDNSPTRHLRTEILVRAGYHVVNVETVRDAVTSVATTRPDVILCDVKLPDGSGFEVCREVRARHPGLPVILVSAVYRDEYAKQSGVFGGASEYLVEPLRREELLAAIKRQCGRTR